MRNDTEGYPSMYLNSKHTCNHVPTHIRKNKQNNQIKIQNQKRLCLFKSEHETVLSINKMLCKVSNESPGIAPEQCRYLKRQIRWLHEKQSLIFSLLTCNMPFTFLCQYIVKDYNNIFIAETHLNS